MHEDDEVLSKKNMFHYQFRSQQDDRDCTVFHFCFKNFWWVEGFGKKGLDVACVLSGFMQKIVVKSRIQI